MGSAVTRTVGGHRADLATCTDLVEQFQPDGTVTMAAGLEIHRPDGGRDSVHAQMGLSRLGALRNATLARPPLSIARKFDPDAVDEQVERPIRSAVGKNWTAEVFHLRHRVMKSGTVQSSFAIFSKLATIPDVCLSGNLN